MLVRSRAFARRRGWSYELKWDGFLPLGLSGVCPRTPYDPYHGIETRR
jgi:hypothetical protein